MNIPFQNKSPREYGREAYLEGRPRSVLSHWRKLAGPEGLPSILWMEEWHKGWDAASLENDPSPRGPQPALAASDTKDR